MTKTGGFPKVVLEQSEDAYYQNDTGGEIDFILDKETALEIKMTASKQDIEFLNRRARNLPVAESYVVSLDYTKEKQVILATDLG